MSGEREGGAPRDGGQLVTWRRELHKIPELAHAEHATAAFVEDALRTMGLAPTRPAPTALVVAVEGRGRGPTVLWRADIDGLPLEEASGEPFSSHHPGRMHACGHDGHAAIALGLAQRLRARPPAAGRVLLLWQPAEEQHPGGALPLIRDGLLDPVDVVLGLHLWVHAPVGTVVLRPGPVTAHSDRFVIHLQGRGGHGSEPHATVDPVVTGAHLVRALQTVASRRQNPLDAVVLTVGRFQAGEADNVIPETTQILGTVRSTDGVVRDSLERALHRIAEGIGTLHGATVRVDYRRGYPAVRNSPEVVRRWRQALPASITVTDGPAVMMGEDFAYYLDDRPGALALVGARPDAASPPASHHAPGFRFHEGALAVGLEAAERAVRALLEPPAHRT